MTTTGGGALIATLHAHGVSTVFGIPGSHNLEIYRHLAAGPIKHVACRHEQGAAYAADGYSRASRGPGVVVTTSGPGILNAAAALASSYADSVPVLAVAPGPPLGLEGMDRGWMHEVKDQAGALDSLVARVVRPKSQDEVARAVCDAFDMWARDRPRPVYIEIPLDVLETEGPVEACTGHSPVSPTAPLPSSISALVDLLNAAAEPVLVVGGGAIGAHHDIRHLAERIGSPVVTTMRGKGVLPDGHDLSVGAVLGTVAGRELLEAADAVVLIGTELSDAELDGRPLLCRGRVCRVDISGAQLSKNLTAHIEVHADAATTIEAVLPGLHPRPVASGVSRAARVRAAASVELGPVTTRHAWIHQALTDVLDPYAVLVGDSSQVTYQGSVHLWPAQAPDSLIAPTSFATLGFGVPAAIGSLYAREDRQTVALVGDGALMFSVQELRTAADAGRALPILVVDNGGYREIAEEMDALGIARTGVDIPPPDFAALAVAMGCAYAEAADASELNSALRGALKHSGPTVVRIPDPAGVTPR